MSTLLNVVAGSPVKAWLTYLGEKYVLDMSIPEIKKDVEVVALNTETGSDELVDCFEYSNVVLFTFFSFSDSTGQVNMVIRKFTCMLHSGL